MINDLPLRELAAAQLGLVTIAQMRDRGFRKDARHRLVDGVRWRRVTPRVARLVGSVDSPAQRALAAVYDAGDGGALDGESAAAWWGIPGNQLEPVTVIRHRDQSGRPNRLGTAREPVLLPADHVVVLEQVPTVVPARALFDVAGRMRRGAEKEWWVARMARMVDNAWAMRLVSGVTLHSMLDDLATRGRPGIRVMRQVLETRGLDYEPPASNLEARVTELLDRHGLPPMRRQVNTGDDRSWIGRVDLRAFDLPLVVEVQSERFHSSLCDRAADRERIERLERAGIVVVEVTDVQVWHRPLDAVELIRAGRRRAQRQQLRRAG